MKLLYIQFLRFQPLYSDLFYLRLIYMALYKLNTLVSNFEPVIIAFGGTVCEIGSCIKLFSYSSDMLINLSHRL